MHYFSTCLGEISIVEISRRKKTSWNEAITGPIEIVKWLSSRQCWSMEWCGEEIRFVVNQDIYRTFCNRDYAEWAGMKKRRKGKMVVAANVEGRPFVLWGSRGPNER